VLGMHRSGTSLLTRILKETGFYAGTPEELLEANNANEAGFWERFDAVNLNEWILRITPPLPKPVSHPLTQWDEWQYGIPVRENDLPESASLTLRASLDRLFESLQNPAQAPWVLKDPRMCLTLPLWRPWLTQAFPVLVTRGPVEVARSLQKRDGLSFHHGLALWEAYNRAAFHFTTGHPRLVIRFEDLRRDPVRELGNLAARLQAWGFQNQLDPRTAGELIRPDLIHHRADEDLHPKLLTSDQQSLLEQLTGPERETVDPGLEPGPSATRVLQEFAAQDLRITRLENETRALQASTVRFRGTLRYDEEAGLRGQRLLEEYSNFSDALSSSRAWQAANAGLRLMFKALRRSRPTPGDMLRQLKEHTSALLPTRPRSLTREQEPQVLVVILNRNHEAFINACLENCLSQNLTPYLLDLGSTDSTRSLAETFLGRGLAGMETLPASCSPSDIQAGLNRLAAGVDCDWVMLTTPDQIRRPPHGYGGMKDFIGRADREGFNAISFQQYIFLPVRESPDHAHPEYCETMRWYYPLQTDQVCELNCWKTFGQQVTWRGEGAGKVDFPGLHLFQQPGIIRRYPVLSLPAPGEDGAPERRPPSAADLKYYISDEQLDPGNPRRTPLLDLS